MSRYVYEANKVSTSLDRLEDAINCLNSTEAALNNGFNMLANSQGAENIDFGQNKAIVCGFPSEAKTYINELKAAVEGKRTEIEEYNSAPWYKKLFASLGMGIAKFGEGLIATFENIGDACVSLVGFAGGLFNKDFQNACGEFIKKDLSRGAMSHIMSSAYTEGSFINKYSAFSETSTCANIIKGVGTATGYVLLSMAGVSGLTKIAGKKVLGSTAMNTIAAGVGGLGSGTEIGLLQGKSYNEAFGQGVKVAAIQASIAYVAGKVGDKLKADKLKAANEVQGKAITKVVDSSDDILTGGQKALTNSGDDVINGAQKLLTNGGDDVINGTQKLLTNGGDDVINGTQKMLPSSGSGSTKLLGPGPKAGQLALPEAGSTGINNSLIKATGQFGDDAARMAADSTTKVESKVAAASSKVTSGDNLMSILKKEGVGDQVALYGERTAETSIKGLVSEASITASKEAASKLSTVTTKSNFVGKVAASEAANIGEQGLVKVTTNVLTNSLDDVVTSAAANSTKFGSNIIAGGSNLISGGAKVIQKAAPVITKTIGTVATKVVSNPSVVSTTLALGGLTATNTVSNVSETAARGYTPITPVKPNVTPVDNRPILNSNPYKDQPMNYASSTGSVETNVSKPNNVTSNVINRTKELAEQKSGNIMGGNNHSQPSSPSETYVPSTEKMDRPSINEDYSNNVKPSGTNNNNSETPINKPNKEPLNNKNDTSDDNKIIQSGGNKYPTNKPKIEGTVSKNNISTTTVGSSGSTHGGGGYSDSGYSFGGSSAITSDGSIGTQDTKGSLASSITTTKSKRTETIRISAPTDELEEVTTSNNYVIPTSAALSAAAAAGIGAKLYMDKKEKNEKDQEPEVENQVEDDIEVDFGSEIIDNINDDYNYNSSSTTADSFGG